MPFLADLHVHSKYSRATSRDLDLEHLALWAYRKGIAVVATGDFTHPAWMAEIREKLVPAEPGLFRLRDDLDREARRQAGVPVTFPVRFMLEVEISTIYKKGERVRKVHHLIYVPDLEKAERLREALGRIGNLAADGRPILGLDSRDLLEITLEAGEGCYLVPAHIWTPWFSVLGSKSGFNSIEECYGDLADHIFAVETGLSSDPPMNWRLSALDRYTLVSNSDAHSPAKLGREACLFDTALDYFAIKQALETGQGYGGTVEFFPEEGKYHLDGHRACGVRLEPAETRALGGRCPVCGRSLTVGVLHRVEELADRPEGTPPARPMAFESLIPLVEVLAEIENKGAGTKAVQQRYERLLRTFGPELTILREVPLEDLQRRAGSLLAEAVRRMRAGEVIREAGYDGAYGVIRLFTDAERAQGQAVGLLFDLPAPASRQPERPKVAEPVLPSTPPKSKPTSPSVQTTPTNGTGGLLIGLDDEQRAAATHTEGPVLVVAGPGTGKTRTLTYRLAYLVREKGVDPAQCLAVTFTRRAADEMRGRLSTLLGKAAESVTVTTFHGLGLELLQTYGDRLGLPQPLRVATEAEQRAALEAQGLSATQAQRMLARLSYRKRTGQPGDERLEQVLEGYDRTLREIGCVDYDDLIRLSVQLLENHPDVAAACRARFRWIAVDEFQDVDANQYRLLRLLAPETDARLFVIGDPDQAIYSFRGGDVHCFLRFADDYPATQRVVLRRNYRSSQTILEAAARMMAHASLVPDRELVAVRPGGAPVEVVTCPSERSEAIFVAETIERLIGGTSFYALDSARADGEDRTYTFGDVAVLYRTEAQAAELQEVLGQAGIPYQKRSHRLLAELPEVEALLAYLAEHPEGTLTERLAQWAASTALERQELLGVLRSLADQCGDNLETFRNELTLRSEADLWDARAEGVALLTLHAAKGLEFRIVFIVGCEEGLLPLTYDGRVDPAHEAEERRLFFVGMTRAQEQLFLTHAQRRRWMGRMRTPRPSRFLADLPMHVVRQKTHAVRRAAVGGRQLELF
ncbi:UvrD-helicase domain-containing protein [Rhodothermus profundi]|uniref:DNA 3'-5' helicase n=1 Tax=Rhodothermus profundi TaxID=633813 RepID=A0A1M6VWL6_9BACT|nr:UvrD-helicase domain-containing protein [Rhodothermus profundi]SHK85778.1 TIGR00375 family protein [Rhodothermus profundi]